MIQRRVEDPAGGRIRGRDLHLGQLFVPRRIGRRSHGLEIPAREFGREVGFGTLDAHGRESYLHEELFAIGRRERGASVMLAHRPELREGFREFGHEVDFLVLGPARRVAPTADRAVVDLFEVRLGGLVPAASVFKVEDHGGLLRSGERIAVQADTRRGRHLGRDAVAHERHRVIAGPHDLLRPVGIGPHPRGGILFRAAGAGHLAHYGHERHVEQVADTRSGEVGVRKSDYRGVRDVVARAPVPLLGNTRGSHLYEPERDVGPDEDMSVSAGADFGVDPAGQTLRGLRL